MNQDPDDIYNIYETLIFLLNGFAFGCIIKDLIKDKFSLILSFVFITLYMYGFPYQAYLMGFSYLGLGLMFIVGIVATINLYYRKQEVKEDKKDKKDEKDKSDKKYEYENNFSNKWLFVMIGILSFGLIFSYSLLTPVVFASILIILFVRVSAKRTNLSLLLSFALGISSTTFLCHCIVTMQSCQLLFQYVS